MSKYENDPFYEEKYFVVKNSTLYDVLMAWRKHHPEEECGIIEYFFKDLNKCSGNKEYLVINQDESYADEVWNLIRNHEAKEIIAFVGRAGAGKDYQSDLLVEKGYMKMSFADVLRKIAYTSLDLEVQDAETYNHMKADPQCITVNVGDKYRSTINFRRYLELLGTQSIRKYDEDFWVNCLIKDIKESNVKKICISDLRFTNEFFKIKKFAKDNGYLFKCIFCDYHSDRYQENNTHDSAQFSNYLATHGYEDLQEIDEEDCLGFLDYKRELEFGI